MSADQSKYQKLVQEYQKQRAQITVLKKAVIDEQNNNKTLQETLKQRDQTTRKYEQEIDSLQFRNEQLSKRVEILQVDLDDFERGGVSRSSGDHRVQEIAEDVREQELQMKIKENEILHQQLHEANQQHQVVVRRLEERLEQLERESGGHGKVMEDTNARYNRMIERLQDDRALLEAQIKKQEEELKIANIMTEKYQQQLKGVHKEIKDKLEKTTKILQEKVPFNDTDANNLNILNVPVCDRAHQIHARELVENFTNVFNDFMSSLSDYHTYIEQRISIYSVDTKQEQISPINQKFSSHLRENATVLRQLKQAMLNFNDCMKLESFISLETCSGLQYLSHNFHMCTKYLEKLLPYHILSVEEECQSPSCTERLEKLNKEFIRSTAQMTSVIQRINRCLALLASFSKHPSLVANSTPCFKQLHRHLQQLSSCIEGMCTNYIRKTEDEHQQPNFTERLRNTDQCILSSLSSLSTAASKMLKFFDANVSFISRHCGFKRKGVAMDGDQGFVPSVKTFQTKASCYMQELHRDASPSIPYSIAVRNNRTLVTSTESRDTLAQQVASAQKSISKLEQDKEHWILEAQLLKVKYDKEVKKVNFLGDELRRAKTENLQRPTTIGNESIDDMIQRERMSPTKTSSISSTSSAPSPEILPLQHQELGTLETRDKEWDSGDHDRDHEELVKIHLTSRITDLTKQVQQTDNKAVTFYAECRALYKQFVLVDKNKKKIANELNQASHKIESLQDELETTKRSYEDQLKMLSDHLCGMNDKLTSQKDQIDALKTTKGGGKLGFGRKK